MCVLTNHLNHSLVGFLKTGLVKVNLNTLRVKNGGKIKAPSYLLQIQWVSKT